VWNVNNEPKNVELASYMSFVILCNITNIWSFIHDITYLKITDNEISEKRSDLFSFIMLKKKKRCTYTIFIYYYCLLYCLLARSSLVRYNIISMINREKKMYIFFSNNHMFKKRLLCFISPQWINQFNDSIDSCTFDLSG